MQSAEQKEGGGVTQFQILGSNTVIHFMWKNSICVKFIYLQMLFLHRIWALKVKNFGIPEPMNYL